MGTQRRVTEGTEGLSAHCARVWAAMLTTLQTLRAFPMRWQGAEGLEGLWVNRPHARAIRLSTLRTLRAPQSGARGD